MHKRGQAAVEFLMTYGWAFMLIMITLGVLAYVGVFDFETFANEECRFLSSILCVDAIATTNGVNLSIQNGLPLDIENIYVYIPDCAQAFGPTTLASGSRAIYSATCSIPQEMVFRSQILFNFTNPDSGINHTKIGTITYRVN